MRAPSSIPVKGRAGQGALYPRRQYDFPGVGGQSISPVEFGAILRNVERLPQNLEYFGVVSEAFWLAL